LDVVRFLVRELGADVKKNETAWSNAAFVASCHKRADVVTWLIKAGADPQISDSVHGMAADISKIAGA
jgi:hypothetical protein